MSLARDMVGIIDIRLRRDKETIQKFPWWAGFKQRPTHEVLKRDVELFMSSPEYCNPHLSELSETGREIFALTIAVQMAFLVRVQLEEEIEKAMRSPKNRLGATLRAFATTTVTWLCAMQFGHYLYTGLIDYGPHRQSPHILEHPFLIAVLITAPLGVKALLSSSLQNSGIVLFFIVIASITIVGMWLHP